MALSDTDTLNIPVRGIPAEYIINLSSDPSVDTGLLNGVSRGIPVLYIHGADSGGAGGPFFAPGGGNFIGIGPNVVFVS